MSTSVTRSALLSLFLLIVSLPISRAILLCSTSFSNFQFAPNGVCLQPSVFYDRNQRTFTMRNVPGTGDCMFLAVALATATSMGLGGNDALLRAISKESRQVVAQILSLPIGNLYVEGKRIVSARDLLLSSSRKENITPEEYLRLLRLEGVDGGLYGGGPELTVLSNILRRPISVYELVEEDNTSTTTTLQLQQQKIICKGAFGVGVFDDPCKAIPNSAVRTVQQPGAYSWHLHILVVDVGLEKHACVLLPQELL